MSEFDETINDDANMYLASDASTQLENLFRLLTVSPDHEDFQFAKVAKIKLHKVTSRNVKYVNYVFT